MFSLTKGKNMKDKKLNIHAVSERFSSAHEYVKYMDGLGHTFKDDFDSSKPMSEYPSDFRRAYFMREWHRIKTIEMLIERIERLEDILNAR
jgi:hypothetical protein